MKSSTKPSEQTPKAGHLITFTKIKGWYLPVDVDSYKVLVDVGVPMIRIPENFLPTLKLITKKHKIKARLVDFDDEIKNPFLDNLGEKWGTRKHCKAVIDDKTMRFETTDASIHTVSAAHLLKIENAVRTFLTRWGYQFSVENSESRGKRKLHIQYRYNGDTLPILHLERDITAIPPIKLKLGYTMVTLRFSDRDVEVNISKAAGGKWTSIDTSRCLYSQIGNVMPMLVALGNVINKDQYNSENPNE
jgi:hypothetical protein